jgi:hypothetical protein
MNPSPVHFKPSTLADFDYPRNRGGGTQRCSQSSTGNFDAGKSRIPAADNRRPRSLSSWKPPAKPTVRVWADRSPFELQERLKRRGLPLDRRKRWPAQVLVHRFGRDRGGRRDRVSEDGDLPERHRAAPADADRLYPLFNPRSKPLAYRSIGQRFSASRMPALRTTAPSRERHI